MTVKKLIPAFYFIFCFSVVQAQSFSPKTEALRQFESYKPTIEAKNKGIVQPPTAITGDLNNDGLQDCILFFVLTPKEGGNAVIDRQTAVYLNTGKGMKVSGSFPAVDFCYVPTRIDKGIVYADDYVCAPPYMEKKGTKKFRYSKGKIVVVN